MLKKHLENQSLHVNQLENQSHWFEQTINETLEKWNDYRDDYLWKIFRKNYENTTEEFFQIVSNDKLKKLRDALRQRDVWVQKDISVARALINTLLKKAFSKWSEENQFLIVSVIESTIVSVIESAIVSVSLSTIVSVIESAIVSVNQSLIVLVNQSAIISVIESAIVSVLESAIVSVN